MKHMVGIAIVVQVFHRKWMELIKNTHLNQLSLLDAVK
jgi:hypothetical protein